MTSTPDIIKKLEQIVALEEKATPGPVSPDDYDGIGWVTAIVAGVPAVVATCDYSADRDLFIALRNSIPTLKEAVKVIERQREARELAETALMCLPAVSAHCCTDGCAREPAMRDDACGVNEAAILLRQAISSLSGSHEHAE